MTGTADPAANPDPFVTLIVRLAESSPVTDNRVVAANRTCPRQPFQWNYPGSGLPSVSANAIKKIMAGVKVRR